MVCARMTSNRMTVMIDGVNYADGNYEELEKLNDPKVHAFFEH